MKIGAIYPQIELNGDPAGLGRIGRAAEALGYDYLLMFDHVAGAEHAGRERPLFGPYTEKDPFHDPFVSFGYLAGVTDRIEFVTGILVLPQRQTLLVARQAADVDLLSGGRLRLGVGVGWNHLEYQALGVDFATRGARMDEQIGLIRRLWREPLLSVDGRFHRLDRLALNPRPRRQIPIWCGGGSEPALRRAAKLGDGFVFSGDLAGSVLPAWRKLQDLLEREGRAVESFGAEYLLPDRCPVPAALNMMRVWEEAGGTHLGVRTMGLGFTCAEQHIDHLAEVRRQV